MSSTASTPTPDHYGPASLAGYDSALLDEAQHTASQAELQPVATPVTPAAEPCPKCEARTFTKGAEWCSACGWYPRLGFYVEPDPIVTGETQTGPKPWYREIPLWAWKLGAGLVVLGIVALVGRVITEDGSTARMVWALAMFVGGLLAVVVTHVMAYVTAIFDDAQLGPLDFVIRPLSVWASTLRRFPETFRRVAAAGWGLSSAFLAMAVVGGLPYYLLLSWAGDKAAPKTNLVQAVVSQGFESQEEGDGDLGGAIKNFAGEKGDEKDKDDKSKELDEKARELAKRPNSVDCVILGYLPQGKNSFESLVLGADVEGKLKVVGLVSEGIEPDLKAELFTRMQELHRKEPLVPTQIEAVWLDPKLTCRVRFKNWTEKKRLNGARFQETLTDL